MSVDFLSDLRSRTWDYDREANDYEYHIGEGNSALEIVVTDHGDWPTKEFLRGVYLDRRGNRVNPILVVALYDDSVGLCGPSGEEPPVYRDVDPGQAERVCETALKRPNRLAAREFLTQTLPQLEQDLAGLRNQGLLSTHELRVGVPEREDWRQANEEAQQALSDEPRELMKGLGYGIERLTDQSWLLRDETDGHNRAVAVFLEEESSFDHAQERFVGKSPVAYALNEADKQNLDYVIASRDGTLRLYTTNPEAGFGSRGRTDTYVEINTDLLSDEKAGYLWLLFSSGALRKDGTLHDIMERSKDYAADLGARLRERIYDDVVPDLAEAIADARDIENPTKEELDETYQMTLVLLYRLLFIAYAEDEEFLPRRRNERYERQSLKRKARDLHEFVREDGEFDGRFTDHWDDVMRLSRSIHDGHEELGLPAYDGRLLSENPDVSGAGALLSKLRLDNEKFGPVLVSLLIDETDEGYEGPVDFRNIGVREFGVIYEGLLESELSVADRPLGIEKDNDEEKYVPVEPDSEHIVVEEGEIYLHGQSGERKATGTYYTKSRFVEHLLDYSLDPALDAHIERIDQLREEEGEAAAADAFFDLRVADIAMGSGHFLVGAVDRIESRLYSYLTENPLAAVEEELDNLKQAAEEAFADTEYSPAIERGQLLRRQVARRCIYGVDLNPLATELARLSIWVHTFVPGLPLTFLDYNLVTGDSLAGIGTLKEAAELLGMGDEDESQMSLGFLTQDQAVIDEIREDISRIGNVADASAQEVQEARETRAEIEERLNQVRARLDILAASRINDELDAATAVSSSEDIIDTDEYELAQQALESTNPLHFPISFPEVFNEEAEGFDVIIGNPPWEESDLEKDEFWTRFEPGLQREESIGKNKDEKIRKLEVSRPDLKSQYIREKEEQNKRRSILKSGPFPGMGAGDVDTYKAFSWRFWTLVNEGYVGAVLPGGAFIGAGSEDFRREVLKKGDILDITFLKNDKNWVFDNVHPQKIIGMIGAKKVNNDKKLPIRGPFSDEEDFQEGVSVSPHWFTVREAFSWTGKVLFPMLPADPRSVGVFKQIASHPPLDYNEPNEWRVRPNRELDETNDKTKDDGTILIHTTDEPPENDFWPVFDGGSLNPSDKPEWVMDTGQRFGWADPDVMLPYLQEARENSYRYAGKRSAFYEMPEEWIYDRETLPCLSPRIAYRHVTQRTNRRTILASLVPSQVFLTNAAPYFLQPRGTAMDEAYLLGVMNSIPFDWYARLFVEANVNYHILYGFRVPRPGENSKLRERVIQLAGRLAAEDNRYADWADRVGVNYGPLDRNVQLDKIYELDAVISHLYGLTREHIEVIFETFHDKWDHRKRLARVLEYYDEWADRSANDETGQSETEVSGRA